MPSRGLVWTPDPLNRRHPLLRARRAWWLSLPHLVGGGKLWDAVGLAHGTLTSYASGYGWTRSTRPGSLGGMCLANDATGGYLSSATVDALNIAGPVTVSGWVKTSASGFRGLVSRYNPGSPYQGYGVAINTTTLCFWNGSGWYYSSSGNVSDGNWWFVTAVANGSTAAFYRNGVFDSSTPMSVPGSYSGPAVLGTNASGGESLVGSMEDFAIDAVAFSAAEVAALYQESLLGYPETINWLSPTTYVLFGMFGGASDVAVTVSGASATAAATGSPTIVTGIVFTPSGAAATATVGSSAVSSGVVVSTSGAGATAVANDPTSVLAGVITAPSGAAATSAVGNPTVTAGTTFTVTGAAATAGVGSVSVGGGVVVSSSTVGATAAVGSVTTVVGVAFTPSAATATAEVGGVSVGGDTQVSTSTVGATAAVGSASVVIGVAFGVAGPEATAAAGSVSIVTGVAVDATGALATASVGAAAAAIGVAFSASGANAVSAVGVVTVTGTAGEDVEVIVVGAEAFAFAGPVGVRTIRTVQPDPWKSTSSPTVAGNNP